MKKISAFSLVLFILFVSACSNRNNAVDTLKKEYPKSVKVVADQLPKNVQKELIVPEKLPFKEKNVSLDVQKNKNGEVDQTVFIYENEVGVIMYVETAYNKKTTFSREIQKLKTTKLDDGTKVIIEADTDDTKIIRWKKDELNHSISLLDSSETGNYSIKDLVRSANSMSK
ncbi:hypothetical protein [Gottfriedia luciferensis]|uniref:hypothetical protein n=1 Tax=Gottfriedia luciferensis TaxID=178774 RepID=UPI000B45046A|nr:hypothetical protein [Gottfriedia luciferensis]